MKKRVISLLAAAIMLVCAMSTVAFAAEGDYNMDLTAGTVWNIGTLDVGLANNPDGSLLCVVDGVNPILLANFSGISTSYKYMVMEVKNETVNTNISFFFSTTNHNLDGAERMGITISANDTETKTYVVDMSTNAYWTGDLTLMRLDLNQPGGTEVIKGNVTISGIRFTNDPGTEPEVPEVSENPAFDFSADSAGWYLGTNDVEIGRDGEAMLLTTKGANPIILSSAVSFPATRYMIITMKNTVPTTGMNIFFKNHTMADFAGDAVVTVPVQVDEDYVDYVVDMSGQAKWVDAITQFRWDLKVPVGGEEGTVSVKSIRFVNELPTPEPPVDDEPPKTGDVMVPALALTCGLCAAAVVILSKKSREQ